jgi:hypothetical protein
VISNSLGELLQIDKYYHTTRPQNLKRLHCKLLNKVSLSEFEETMVATQLQSICVEHLLNRYDYRHNRPQLNFCTLGLLQQQTRRSWRSLEVISQLEV